MPPTLPTEKSIPTKAWNKQVFLMIGAGKIGKSAFWAAGDKTLFLDFEGGLSHLSTLKISIRSWTEFTIARGELSKAARDGKFPYDTLVIDTFDKLVERANEEVVDLAKERYQKIADRINFIGDVPEGIGWYMATTLITNTLDKLRQLPAAIVLVSHISSKEFSDGIRKFNKDTISIGGQTGTKILHMVDHTLHIRARMIGDKIERVIRTKPTESMEAGSRGLLVPDGFQWSEDNTENYTRFRALFE